ncbi:TPA: hypothetical protein ACU3MR_002534 [Staphylococcus aureus]
MTEIDMLKAINTLFNSDIESNLIAKETGISIATISKLRSGNKDVSKSSFETVNKLYLYYLERKNYFDMSEQIEKHILDIKLPKEIQSFISELKKVIDAINDDTNPLSVHEISIIKKFTMSRDKKSTNLMQTIQIEELIPIQIKRKTFAYNLNIINDFEDKGLQFNSIKNLKIDFLYNELEIALKRHVNNGDKLMLIKSNLDEFGNSNTGLFVNGRYNYELNFMKVSIYREGVENG